MAWFPTADISWPVGIGLGAFMGAAIGVRVALRHTWPQARASREVAEIREAAARDTDGAGAQTVLSIDGRTVSVTVAEYDRGTILLAGGVVALMLCFLVVLLVLAPADGSGPAGRRWTSIAAVVLLVPVTVNVLADGIRGRRIGAADIGLIYGRRGNEILIPWTTVSSITTFARRQPMLGIDVTDTSAIRGGRLARLARRIPALSTEHDLALPLRPLDSEDLAAVLRAADHYAPVDVPSSDELPRPG